ncbi:peptidoglycan glycosyltransferase [Deinococcus irradiatisoli]|uniref:peptidoglycan glycosyltransferase n=1 Tax=Deinococcus irradiatisoli TaxID=2202254 RepID=A0A2Z3JJW5_9DEIO|nr:transglycosylase domain-containing protein [Deinococcus irradiatisoli]AWN23861.1 peptidoglycan glycosyltransferase [Deinococcus irradiatisoli]
MRFLLRILSALLILAALVGVAAGGMWYLWERDLPSVADLDVLEFSGTTRVYDRQNKLVATLTPALTSGQSVNRNLLPLNQISSWARKAVITSEDRRFYDHGGVDVLGIARGLLKGIFQNDLEGGSSITQQVVKNTLLTNLKSARTPERKFKEAVLAYQLEDQFSKDQILNAYLNVIYWGDGGKNDIIGIGSAAQAYFRKPASQLNLAESAYLAVLIPAPNTRYKDFTGFRPLMKDLLTRMVQDGRATQAEADAAWRQPIYPSGWRIGWGENGKVLSATLERPQSLYDNTPAAQVPPAFHFMQALEQQLAEQIGRKALYGGGKVYATLDLQDQRAAERASLNAQLPDGATLGIALLDPMNGEVRALVGQKLTGGRPADWNNAVQARRQVGSSVKPLLYTLALSQGWKQSDTVLDSPLSGDYQPQNYDGRWTGRQVTLRYALDHSLNLPTVRLGQQVGMDKFEDKLRDLGMTPPTDAGLSLSIGTLEASPLQMAAAYAPFANGGVYYAPSLVRRVEDARGKVIYARPAPTAKRVWDAQTAWLGLDMIRGVVNDLDRFQGGLGYNARIEGREVAGKTGTTNDIKDLWFVGTTPTLTGAVWVGKQEGGSLPAWAYSGTIPAPIWQQAVAGSLEGTPVAAFKEPPGIEYAVVRRVNMAFRTQPPAPAQPQTAAEPVPASAAQTSPAQTSTPATSQAAGASSQTTPDASAPASAYPQPEDLVPSTPQTGTAADPTFPDEAASDPDVDFQGNQGEVQIVPQGDSSGTSSSLAPPEAPPGN